jgi:2-polyprenyl-3-methyl-5-hydroxy-6-metoxy-1,4-benzoquinol methylase
MKNNIPVLNNQPEETLYGVKKRFLYCHETARKLLKNRTHLEIIELGCGTGEGLLFPLAQNFGDQVTLLGVDTDINSIRYAQEKAHKLNLSNLSFLCFDAEKEFPELKNGKWDMVIASEVLEHIESPRPILETCHNLLHPDGLFFFTIPNGYGPFEWESFIWNTFGFNTAYEKIKHKIKSDSSKTDESLMTLNSSNGHVGFYSWSNIKQMLDSTGFEFQESRNNQWFCGPFSDKIFSALRFIKCAGLLARFSQKAGDALPPAFVSDWMILARKKPSSKGFSWPQIPHTRFEQWWWNKKKKKNSEV